MKITEYVKFQIIVNLKNANTDWSKIKSRMRQGAVICFPMFVIFMDKCIKEIRKNNDK